MKKDMPEKPQRFYKMDDEQAQQWGCYTPGEMTERPQFVVWRSEFDNNRWTKIPYDPKSGKRASTISPATWATFDEALAACYEDGSYDGIGFVLTLKDEFIAVDLDKCHDANTYTIEPWAQDIIDELDSYTEISPSGTGIRILLRGKLPSDCHRKGNIEVYEDARFVTITGHPLLGLEEVEDRYEAITAWHAKVFPPAATPMLGDSSPASQIGAIALSDQEILEKAFRAKNGDKTQCLYNGDISSYGNNPSSADLGLIKRLSFYTQDVVQLDRLFRTSRLHRGKWDERRGKHTYGYMTILRALRDASSTYSAPRQRSAKAKSSVAVLQGLHMGIVDQASPTGHTLSLDGVVNNNVPTTKPQAILPDARSSDVAPSEIEIAVNPLNLAAVEKPEGYSFRYLRTISHLDSLPPRQWLIDGILQSDEFCVLAGAYKNGKTFVMLDMAFSIACGIPYHGHAVKQGPVVIIEAEGVGGLRARIKAWLAGNPEADASILEQNVALVTEAVQVCDHDQLQAFLDDLEKKPKPPMLTVIDTLARANAGKDENSVHDMSLFVGSCDKIRQATGGAVMVLHHTNKNGDVRGSTALPGAADTTLMCTMNRARKIVTLHSDNRKDGEDLSPLNFSLESDAQSGSVYLKLVDGQTGSRSSSGRLNPKEQQIVDALKTSSVEWHRLKDIKMLVSTLTESMLQKCIKGLVEKGLLELDGDANRTRYRLSENRDITFH